MLAFSDDSDQLATVAVTGVARTINIGLVRDEGLDIGDWVLLHVGFALEIISEQETTEAMEGLQLLGSGLPEDDPAADEPAGGQPSDGSPPGRSAARTPRGSPSTTRS